MLALDTNTLIYFFKGTGRVGERMLTRAPSEIAIPAIVAYEIETGIAKSASPDKRRASAPMASSPESSYHWGGPLADAFRGGVAGSPIGSRMARPCTASVVKAIATCLDEVAKSAWSLPCA